MTPYVAFLRSLADATFQLANDLEQADEHPYGRGQISKQALDRGDIVIVDMGQSVNKWEKK